MLTCDGYKMFYGTARIVPKNDNPPYEMRGTWLYKPEYDCWYCKDETGWVTSMSADVVTDIYEEDQP